MMELEFLRHAEQLRMARSTTAPLCWMESGAEDEQEGGLNQKLMLFGRGKATPRAPIKIGVKIGVSHLPLPSHLLPSMGSVAHSVVIIMMLLHLDNRCLVMRGLNNHLSLNVGHLLGLSMPCQSLSGNKVATNYTLFSDLICSACQSFRWLRGRNTDLLGSIGCAMALL